jgi:pyruvate-ferredoxin/flavodoxin oxidoreductase
VFESKDPTGTIADFLKGEVRYSTLVKQFPEEAKVLHTRLAKEYAERFEMYKKLAGA